MGNTSTTDGRRAQVLLPAYLSWSSLSSYAECGERWRLERGHRVEASTWFATIAGSAIHEITEDIDRNVASGMDLDAALLLAPSFEAKFEELLAKEKREVKPSGRAQKTVTEGGGPNKKDKAWWLKYGPIYVQRWVEFRRASPWEIMVMPDGTLGVEVEFEIEIDGVRLKGYIDRVFWDPETESVIVVDLKTGKEPAGALQLGTYKLGLAESLLIDAEWGAFWTPAPRPQRTKAEKELDVEDDRPDVGKLSEIVPLTRYDNDWLVSLYQGALRGIRAGVFLPTVTNMCSGCVVREHCRAVRGVASGNLILGGPSTPTRSDVVDRETGEVLFGPSAGDSVELPLVEHDEDVSTDTDDEGEE